MYIIKWHRVGLTLGLLLIGLIITKGCGTLSDRLLYNPSLLKDFASDYKDELQIRLYQHKSRTIVQISLEQYIVGVVAAEMPVSFETEALKAQAVAARTYILRKMPVFQQASHKRIHNNADICDLPEHGQAWIDDQTMRSRWGSKNFAAYMAKIQSAVSSTEGIVLTYRGELINPLYYASCGGLGTESALTVWGKAVPYLTEVNCPENQADPKNKRHYILTAQEIDRRLGTDLEAIPVVNMDGNSKTFKVLAQSSRGRIKLMLLGQKELTGNEIRSKLQLASTRFTMKKVNQNLIEIDTIGAGHAVGMCQRGAQAMALEKCTYSNILTHFYPGTSLSRIVIQH